ncbi:urease accessory protein UreD (plasmid) [Rhodobacteraceae bacterium M382]|nr:urease accessory protein UreD [Rhodobacteraceae bacterium M382]
MRVSTKRVGGRTVLDGLRQSGSFKCLFPKARGGTMDAVLLNTAGGITGGDQFSFSGHVAANTALTLTTQACERAYRAQPNQTGQIRNRIRVEPGARLNWLPQETILFNGSALDRRLNINLALDASLLMVEPMVFGRPAMGETLTDIRFRDRIEIRREGAPLFLDSVVLSGDLHAHLSKPFIANGAGATALTVLVAEDAERHLGPLREVLPETGGVSMIQSDVLVLRLLAVDDFTLRQTLLPVLQRLNGSDLPRCWMI